MFQPLSSGKCLLQEPIYKMKLRGCFLFLLALTASACMDVDDYSGFRLTSFTYNFNESSYDWQYDFADYPSAASDSSYALQYDYGTVPGMTRKGIMLSGDNHSDDLFMYIKKKLVGLDPNTTYTITFDITLASDAKEGELGAGGAPGESVFVKVGASTTEPKTVTEGDQFVMNIDKGDQSANGANMKVIGNIAVPENSEGFQQLNLTNSPYNSMYNTPVVVTTNNDGELWLIVGTDSGFEGVTTVYYLEVAAVLSQIR
jgi:hypothetical protein